MSTGRSVRVLCTLNIIEVGEQTKGNKCCAVALRAAHSEYHMVGERTKGSQMLSSADCAAG